MVAFLANKINATDRDVTVPTEQVQMMLLLKDKNVNLFFARYLKLKGAHSQG